MTCQAMSHDPIPNAAAPWACLGSSEVIVRGPKGTVTVQEGRQGVGGNGPMVPEALTCKEQIRSNGEDKWENKVQTNDGKCQSGLGTPGKGLLDKGLAWKCFGASLPPWSLGKNGHAGSQAGCEER